MLIRNATESDYFNVVSVINEWWGGRQMAAMLPRLFFKHFSETSYILEENGKMIGFWLDLFLKPILIRHIFISLVLPRRIEVRAMEELHILLFIWLGKRVADRFMQLLLL